MTIVVDADDVILSTHRALQDYVITNAKNAAVYNIIWGYPSADAQRQLVPFKSPVVHFEISDIQNPKLGLGDLIMQPSVDEATGQTIEYEATQHIFEISCGIWASAQSGGVTMRLQAYSMLRDLFCGAKPYYYASDVHGFEIQDFQGATFLVDSINDQEVYRVEDMTLMIQVFGRHTYPIINYLEKFKQAPTIYIDGVLVEKDLILPEAEIVGTDVGVKT